MNENYLRGMLAGAILGVWAYVLVSSVVRRVDRELDRLDRNLQDHVFPHGGVHAPAVPYDDQPPAPTHAER